MFCRMEDKYRRGPYYYYNGHGWMTRSHTPEEGCPSVENEIWEDASGNAVSNSIVYGVLEKKSSGPYQFAFESEKDFNKWFSDEKELDNLYEMGFEKKQIEGELIFRGQKQVIIRRFS